LRPKQPDATVSHRFPAPDRAVGFIDLMADHRLANIAFDAVEVEAAVDHPPVDDGVAGDVHRIVDQRADSGARRDEPVDAAA